MKILTIGLMATGKTTTARLLAKRLGYVNLDNDELVMAATRTWRDDLLKRRGERGLRAAEAAALSAALSCEGDVVAAVAGGVVLDERNRRQLKSSDAVVVWLKAEPSTLASRISEDDNRPWLKPDPLAAFAAMARDRQRLYEEVSTFSVEVDQLSPDEVVDTIITNLPPGGPTPRPTEADELVPD